MTSRDPRIEPRAGDVLSNGRRVVEIDFVCAFAVFVRRYHGEQPCACGGGVVWLPPEEFRAHAREAVVLAEGLP
jgi:hypothetical protein